MNMGFEDIAGMGFRKALEECIYNICRDNGIVLMTTNNEGKTSYKRLANLLSELKDKNVISEYQVSALSLDYIFRKSSCPCRRS